MLIAVEPCVGGPAASRCYELAPYVGSPAASRSYRVRPYVGSPAASRCYRIRALPFFSVVLSPSFYIIILANPCYVLIAEARLAALRTLQKAVLAVDTADVNRLMHGKSSLLKMAFDVIEAQPDLPVSQVLVHVMTTAGVSAGVLKAGQGSAQGGASGEQAVRGTDGEVRPSIRCLQCRCLGHYRNKCPYLPRAPYGGYGAAQGAARMPSVP